MSRPDQSFRAIYTRKLTHLCTWTFLYLLNHVLMEALYPTTGSKW